MKCLRRLEDTDLYLLCDMSSNLDKEEKIYVEGLSKDQISLKEMLIHKETYMQLWSISCVKDLMVIQVKWSLGGLTSNQSASMTMREGNIREIYEISLQNTMPKMIEITKEEETVVKMEEDHKAQIVELEARAPGTPEVDREARAQAFRITSMQMKCHIDDAEALLADATKTWSKLEELPDRLDL